MNVEGTWFHARDREALMSALVVVLGCSLNGIQPEPLYTAPPKQAEPVQQVKTCAWRDNLDAIYETECGNLHIVNDGTLEENGMKYCCYCGKEIKDESPT